MYREGASRFPVKHLFDFVFEHRLDIVWHFVLSLEEAEAAHLLLGSGASMATTLTMGLPALAMMNGSPLTAFAISFERFVLAS